MLDVGPVDLYLCTSLADSKSLPFYEVNVLFFPLYSAGFYWSFFPPLLSCEVTHTGNGRSKLLARFCSLEKASADVTCLNDDLIDKVA